MTRSRRRGEAGASLVLVLVALVVFGLLVPVLGQFGSVNGVSAYIVKGQRYDRYAADSGMQAAIAWAQKNHIAGRDNLACPRLSFNLNAASPAFQRTVHVDCQGFQDSGVPQETPIMPAYALQALGNGKDPGIDILGGGGLKTSGAWWSNSSNQKAIDVDSDQVIDATADLVGGKGTCPNVVAAPTRCAPDLTKVVDDPLVAGLDPTHWKSAVNSIGDVPLRDPFPTGTDPCAAIPPNRVLALQPGFYWDIDGLNRVGSGDCGDVVIWFQPGKFYFDFDFFDDSNSGDAARWTVGGGSHQVVVVGGTPQGWTPGPDDVPRFGAAATAVSRGTANASASGACASGGPGVELDFGSSSHLLVQQPALMELCPLITSNHQQFSIYNTVNKSITQQQGLSVTPSSAVAFGHGDPFDWPDTPPTIAAAPLANLDCIPGPCSDSAGRNDFISGTLIGSRATGTVTMTMPDPVPAGTRLDQFELSITHREHEAQNNDLDQLRMWVEGLPPGVTCDEIGTAARPTSVTPSIDEWATTPPVLSCHIDHHVFGRAYRPLANLRVEYEVVTNRRSGGDGNPDPSVTIDVDQVKLTGHFTRPVVRPVSGCVALAACKLLEIDNRPGASDARAFIWGTVYAPQGSIRLNAGGTSDFGFERGVVARSVSVDTLPSNDPKFVPFALPGGGSYKDRLVTFEAFLNANTSPLLSARVRFCDPEPELGAVVDGCAQDGGPPRVRAWTPKR